MKAHSYVYLRERTSKTRATPDITVQRRVAPRFRAHRKLKIERTESVTFADIIFLEMSNLETELANFRISNAVLAMLRIAFESICEQSASYVSSLPWHLRLFHRMGKLLRPSRGKSQISHYRRCNINVDDRHPCYSAAKAASLSRGLWLAIIQRADSRANREIHKIPLTTLRNERGRYQSPNAHLSPGTESHARARTF